MPTHVQPSLTIRDRLRAKTRPPRELVITTSGKVLCLLTLGVGFGAVNTGNNLLFLLLGMLLALILASGVLSEAVVVALTARRKVPSRVVAGAPARGAYIVANPRRYASLSIEVSDRNATAIAGPATGSAVGPATVPWWKFWRSAPGEPPVGSAYLLRIGAGEELAPSARFAFEQRGRYRLGTIRVTTRFPFGLFEKSRTLDDEAEVTVLPSGIPANDWVATVRGAFGEVATNARGTGEDFYGLRDYRIGDDRRMIHWRSTARRGETVIRETEALTQREVQIVFCDWGTAPISTKRFEQMVSKTAGMLAALVEDGWRVGLTTRDAQIAPAAGIQQLDRALAALAVVVPTRETFPLPNGEVARVVIGGSGGGEVNIPYEATDA